MLWFKTKEEKILRLKCEIASLKKEVEVLWKLEGNYLFGNRDKIVSVEKKLAYKKKQVELIENINKEAK